VHLREPGNVPSETIASGTAAALAGGYQAVFDMPNNPGNPTYGPQQIGEKIKLGRRSAATNIGFYAGVHLGDPDIDGMVAMTPKAAGLKLYMGHTTGNAREYGLDDARPAIDGWIAANTALREELGAAAITPILLHAKEDVADETARYITAQGHPVHWCHLATAREVLLAGGLTHEFPELYTGGVTPHHLTMTDMNARFQQGWNGARMIPPLGSSVDQERLLRAYNDRTIQILETDHAPHLPDNKLEAEASNPAGKTDPNCTTCFGVSGIEFVLPVMIAAVLRGETSLEAVINSLYTQPAKMLRLRLGAIAHNETEIQIVPGVIEKGDIVGQSSNTPYINWMSGARVTAVIRDGRQVVSKNNPGEVQKKWPTRILRAGANVDLIGNDTV
jgi:dihydroorotase-like cyclic amidohydrolase